MREGVENVHFLGDVLNGCSLKMKKVLGKMTQEHFCLNFFYKTG